MRTLLDGKPLGDQLHACRIVPSLPNAQQELEESEA
jgi:hypothetical protein